MPRFFTKSIDETKGIIVGDDAKHIMKVLRMRPGEKLVACIRERTEKEVKEKVNSSIRLWAAENLPENAQILNKNLNFCYKGNIIEIGVTLEVRQQIGEEQEILVG